MPEIAYSRSTNHFSHLATYAYAADQAQMLILQIIPSIINFSQKNLCCALDYSSVAEIEVAEGPFKNHELRSCPNE